MTRQLSLLHLTFSQIKVSSVQSILHGSTHPPPPFHPLKESGKHRKRPCPQNAETTIVSKYKVYAFGFGGLLRRGGALWYCWPPQLLIFVYSSRAANPLTPALLSVFSRSRHFKKMFSSLFFRFSLPLDGTISCALDSHLYTTCSTCETIPIVLYYSAVTASK